MVFAVRLFVQAIVVKLSLKGEVEAMSYLSMFVTEGVVVVLVLIL